MAAEAPTFRIRGIYATSLTKLLLDEGFKPTQCSKTLLSRFNVEPLTVPPDVDVYDTERRDGVVVEGRREAVERAVKAMEDRLDDVVVRELKPGVNAVVKGVVKGQGEEGSLVDLGGQVGVVPGQRLREGEEVVVTVVKCREGGPPILSLGPRVVGAYAKLLPGDRVSLSSGIKKGSRKASELYSLGRMVRPQGWGLRWRRSAMYVDFETLIGEVRELERRAEELMRMVEGAKAPSTIVEGDAVYVATMYGASRRRLDELRGQVVSTMPRHHTFKSWGKAFAFMVDVLESIGGGLDVMSRASDLMFERAMRMRGQVEIVHVKPNGEVLSLRPGRVIGVRGGEVRLLRRFKGGGVYDGLGEPREGGDYGITTFREGSWWYSTAYYSRDGKLKGVYFNVSTPPEFKPGVVRYLDLCVDVVWSPRAGVKVVDEEEVEAMVEAGHLSRRLADKAISVAHELAEELIRSGPSGLLEGVAIEPATN